MHNERMRVHMYRMRIANALRRGLALYYLYTVQSSANSFFGILLRRRTKNKNRMAILAAQYDNVSIAHQAEDGLALIEKLAPAKSSRVLDLGCGTGYLASVLAKRVGPEGQVIGVDPDKDRIRLAQERYRNIAFFEGNSDNFPEGPYDLIFANHVMHWIKDKEAAFQNAYMNLAEGGRFSIVVSEKISEISYKLPKPVVKKFLFCCTSDMYANIACKCEEFKSVGPRKYIFPNRQALFDWLYASTKFNVESNLLDAATLDECKKNIRGQRL